jgi:hypothetical protein
VVNEFPTTNSIACATSSAVPTRRYRYRRHARPEVIAPLIGGRPVCRPRSRADRRSRCELL